MYARLRRLLFAFIAISEVSSHAGYGRCEGEDVDDRSTLLQLQSKITVVEPEDQKLVHEDVYRAWRTVGVAVVAGAAAGSLVVWRLTKPSQAPKAESKADTLFGQPKEEVLAMLKSLLGSPNSNLIFLSADFCPYDQRVWITLLEKEQDPASPVLFEHVHVGFMGAKDPGTNILKSLGLGPVPAAIHGGRVLIESTPLASYVDDLFPNKPLKPSDPVMKFNMDCFLERHSSISGKFDAFLKNQDKEKDLALAGQLDEVLNIINDDLAKFDGPFLCGQQFTLADINIFGFVERFMVVLPYWKTWSIPESMNRIFEWYDAVKQRPAVKLTMADRSDESMATYCFQAKVRAECIQESNESYARSESSLTR